MNRHGLRARAGHHGESLDPVADAIEMCTSRGWHTGGMVYAELAGMPVLDAAFGLDDNGRPAEAGRAVRWTCASKLALVVACARLHQTGQLGFDDRIADHIPAFRVNGKHGITIRHLLTHTSGLDDSATAMLDGGGSWSETLGAACGASVDPVAVGQVAEYSVQTGWLLLAEVVSRVVGLPPAEAELSFGLAPLGLTGVDQRSHGGYRPGRSLAGPLDQLIRLCRALSPCEQGSDYLSVETRQEVLHPWRKGVVDRRYGSDLSWGLGVAVDGRLFGMNLSSDAFGHLGEPGTFVVFDPARGLAVAARLHGTGDEMRATAARCVLLAAVARSGLGTSEP